MADTQSTITVQEQVDPVIGLIEKSQHFYDENKSTLIGSLIAVLAIIAGVFGYSYYMDTQEEKAQFLLSQAQAYFTSADYSKALKGDEVDFTPGFEQIIANYSGTDAANLAVYYAAVSEFNLGNTDAALGYINKFDMPDGVLSVGPLSFKASVYIAAGNFEAGAAAFEKAGTVVHTEQTTTLFLLEAAKAFEKAGNKSKALQLVEKVLNDYPTGNHVAEAQRIKGRIS